MFYKKFKIWLLAIRAETLTLSICSITSGAFLAKNEVKLNYVILLLTYLYGLFLHIGTNLSNDYFDYLKDADNKNRIAPFSTLQRKLTSLKQIKVAYIISYVLAFLIGLFFLWINFSLVSLFFILPIICGFFYTAGKNALGYLGFGELLVLIFFGPFAVSGTYFLQTSHLSYLTIIGGLGIGFLITSVLVINNLRDTEIDRLANKKTLAVRFGKKFAIIEYYSLILFAFFIPLILFIILKQRPFLILSSLLLVFAPIKLIKSYKKNPFLLNLALQKTVMLVIIYTVFFCIGLVLQI